MRNVNNKDRTRLRNEFVYKYASEIAVLIASNNKQDKVNFVKRVVIKELPYSCTTNPLDIFHSLFTTYQKLFK